MRKRMKTNAFLNLIRVASTVVFSIISFPYTSRVLQVENLGRVNYSLSIVSYFTLLAGLGITQYGVREGAKYRQDRDQFRQFASEAFTVTVLSTAFSYVLLFGIVFLVPRFAGYRELILILSLTIGLTTIGVEWVNTVYEDFRQITIRSVVTQIFVIAGLVLFVRNEDDYIVYAWLLVLSGGITYVMNWFYNRRYVHIRLVFPRTILRHLKPMAVFAANAATITVYVNADMTMIGWMCGDYFTGLYSVSVKIYQLVKQLLGAAYVVSIPQLSESWAAGDKKAFRELFTDICGMTVLFLIPAMTGMFVYAGDIIYVISGASYMAAATSLKILAAALFFAIGSGIVVNCIQVPMGKEKISLQATVLAACINVGLNLILLPYLKQNGAALTTLIAEVFVLVFCLKKLSGISGYLDVHKLRKEMKIVIPETILIIAASCLLHRTGLSSFAVLLSGIGISLAGFIVLLKLTHRQIVFRRKG